MKSKQNEISKRDIFTMGGILAVLGLVAIVEGQVTSGLFLLGLGVVFMASTSKEQTKQVFDFFFSILKDVWKILSPK